jgi:CheY-like chemotaxis protein
MAERSRRQRVVLLVDDSSDTLEMYTLGLSFEGIRTLTASTPEAALALINRERPAVVVTDLHLSGGRSGWDLIERLQQALPTSRIPIVILTGATELPTPIPWQSGTRMTLLPKPCLPEDLARALQPLLEDH